ncbi:carbohydrate ABC transporter permease [Murimonas intestini]|uniref:Carbohydrate ABC transporter membrane protein 2 (CUT1 family) n=1 Tax=Murimonas intestini TaxID=1337051 RepID=A0AB73T5S4_9FIRM|nr:carbohydrate ABC transporter permease [Murimonas intestini]MCR1842185.1 carbohydrate ABC transporter permease [Murimonas intestini]MCR1864920.1 carbohydrate ABC transporter permease [Murimonas intestini]MCR1884248.1 carbohydrate ABC transporter permease [Murimonas intestini]
MNKKNKIQTSASRKVFQVFNYLLMLGIAFICIYPFWYIIIYTFSEARLADVNPPVFLPRGFSLSNYKDIFELNGFFHSLFISVLRTVVGTFASVLSCSFLGYLFTKEEMPARKLMYRFLILTMYVSGGMIATYIVVKSYGLLNNFWVYILPMLISAYNIVLIKTFVEQLPASLEESAKLDGAGYLTIFTKIILPLSKPIIATVAVFVAVNHWNSWFDNHIYARGNESLTTLQYLLYNYLNEAQRLADQIKNTTNAAGMSQISTSISPKGVRMTITVLASLPIFMVYPFMQKYFVKGIMVGAVKG